MYGKKPSPSRRRALLALLIGGSLAALNLSPVTANDENVLVTTYAQDCCPPPDPCAPSVNSYYGSQPAPIQAMPQEGLTAPAPTTSGDLATQPSTSEPSATTPQFDAPISQNTANNLPQASAFTGAAASSLASNTGSRGGLDAPNMIGDSSGGGCGGLSLGGNALVTVDHPIYACSRLNLAENNSAIARDRVYMNYRHYHNASTLDFFGYDPNGAASDFNIDVFTLGFEKLISENCSVEFRLPISTQLDSDLAITSDPAGNNNLSDIFADGRETVIGNIAVILKAMLYRNQQTVISSGLGVNIPTAPDLRFRFDVDDTSFRLVDGSLRDVTVQADGTYFNETVNIQPFLAFLHQPNERLFFQGFLQCDVAANQSTGELDLLVNIDGVNEYAEPPSSGKLGLQTLLRLNLGGGVWLGECGAINGNRIRHAALLEAHYTTTLNDPDRLNFDVPVTGADDITVNIGPLADNTNAVNLVAGFASFVGKSSLYNGFTVPLRDGSDRGFDFEYSLLLNRNF